MIKLILVNSEFFNSKVKQISLKLFSLPRLLAGRLSGQSSEKVLNVLQNLWQRELERAKIKVQKREVPRLRKLRTFAEPTRSTKRARQSPKKNSDLGLSPKEKPYSKNWMTAVQRNELVLPSRKNLENQKEHHRKKSFSYGCSRAGVHFVSLTTILQQFH